MQVLAVSFGRRNSNCDILAKKALLGAKAAGCDVKFINTNNLIIDRCTNCGACDKVLKKALMRSFARDRTISDSYAMP